MKINIEEKIEFPNKIWEIGKIFLYVSDATAYESFFLKNFYSQHLFLN